MNAQSNFHTKPENSKKMENFEKIEKSKNMTNGEKVFVTIYPDHIDADLVKNKVEKIDGIEKLVTTKIKLNPEWKLNIREDYRKIFRNTELLLEIMEVMENFDDFGSLCIWRKYIETKMKNKTDRIVDEVLDFCEKKKLIEKRDEVGVDFCIYPFLEPVTEN